MTPEERQHGQSPPSQASLDRALLSRWPERHRRRISLLQLRNRSRASDRGNGALEKSGVALSQGCELPAREYGNAYGGGFCDGNGPRAGGDGARGRGHGEFRDGDAQRAPRPAAARAYGGQGALHGAGGIAPPPRQPPALHPGDLPPIGGRGPPPRGGGDAALRRGDQGGPAAP